MPAGTTWTRSGLPPLLLLGVLWGVVFPVARVGVSAGASPLLLVALVLSLAAAASAPYAWLTRAPRPRARSLAVSAGLGVVLIAGINLPLYWGLQFATGGAASIVYAASPVVSLLALAAIGTPDQLHRRQLLALALGLLGVVVLGLAATGGDLAAGIAAIGAFVLGTSCQGVGAVLVGRERPDGEGPWGLSFQFVGGAAASFVVVAVLEPSAQFPIGAATVGSLLYAGLVSMAVGYSLFFGLIHRHGAVRANQVTFLNPLVALLVGAVAFGEGFVPLEAVALALVVVALVLLQPSRRVPSSAPVGSAPVAPIVREPA
jgi:drug/metabolite transporter (DMT)-like permease